MKTELRRHNVKVTMPKVRIVADYEAKGYQLDREARARGELPVSEPLKDRLIAWNDEYEMFCRPAAYEDVCGTRFDFVTFAAKGLEIAKAVKRELPGWTVTYWDEGLDWYLSREPRGHDPARAEYEITLKDAIADKTAADKTSLDKASLEKTSLEKTSLDKASLEKTSLEKTSLEKTSLDKTGADKTARLRSRSP